MPNTHKRESRKHLLLRYCFLQFGSILAAAGLIALIWGKDLTQMYLRLI